MAINCEMNSNNGSIWLVESWILSNYSSITSNDYNNQLTDIFVEQQIYIFVKFFIRRFYLV